nr:putative reverse transcriptase domain-containing protein [Tanacetum cinerariifolium]
MLAPSVIDVFHASNLRGCMVDANMHMRLEGIKVEKHSSFCEKPVEIINREISDPYRERVRGYRDRGRGLSRADVN